MTLMGSLLESLSPSISWLSILILTALLVVLLLPKESDHNLAPSPPMLPFLGNIHQIGKLPHYSMYKLAQKYGPIMHLKLGAVRALVISSPEMAKEVLKVHDIECCTRAESYGTRKFSYNQKDISFCGYGDYWREMRKLAVIELFTVKRVRSFEDARGKGLTKMVDIIAKEAADPGRKAIQINERIFSLTKKFICDVAFGTSYEVEKLKDSEIERTFIEANAMFSSFWASDFFPSFGWIIDTLTGVQRKLDKSFDEFDQFYEAVINEHLDPNRPKSEHEDITDGLIAMSKDPTCPVRLTKDHIKAVFMDLFLAPIDTGSATLVWAMTELIKNKRVMKKVQAEVRQVMGNKQKVEESDLEKLKYFKLVVKETLRLHPPVPLLLPREAMTHFKVGGYNVLPKTKIFVNAWAINRDPTAWDSPLEFYPERFEKNDVDYKGQHFHYIPFGAGRRMCPGMTMGIATVDYTLATLLNFFDWDLPAGMKPDDIKMDEKVGLTIHKVKPLYLVPTKYQP
ncbi:cytochrome P450 71B34 [Daucus carota subsp. sativus]|uniref:Cytochrome P450 n=2 Tax=Daucus carota subsp. sativus TaxID=79200 RepID=A0A161ZRW4_DAUCS|nr:PREDICTED: cytochrome P450 71B34-like [Daucus carota subsp. sativus]